MNRRSIFKLLASAVVASSMEVMGWQMPKIKTALFNPVDWRGNITWINYHQANLQGLIPRYYWDGEKWVNPQSTENPPTEAGASGGMKCHGPL